MGSEERRLLEGELYPAGEDGITARFVELASGIRVRVAEAGDASARPIVFVPGWGCTAWIFHDTLTPLAAAGFRVIAVELKGHGLSDKPTAPGEYTVASMKTHLLDILDALDLDRPGIVGHSMGAAIAAHAIAVAPERVSGLVLASPVGFAGVKGMSLFRALTPRFVVSFLPFIATRSLIRVMLRVVYGSIRGPSQRDVEEFHAPTVFPAFTAAMRNLLHEFDWHAPYPALGVPTMVITGSEDLLSPAKEASRYAERAVVVKRAGHVLFDESPAIVNREIASFFGAAALPYISTQNE